MKKICKICGKEFECYDKKRKGIKIQKKLPMNRVTCSKECAKILRNEKC